MTFVRASPLILAGSRTDHDLSWLRVSQRAPSQPTSQETNSRLSAPKAEAIAAATSSASSRFLNLAWWKLLFATPGLGNHASGLVNCEWLGTARSPGLGSMCHHAAPRDATEGAVSTPWVWPT